MTIKMIRYPHGWNRGGIWENEYAPAITTSAWENNNLVMEIYDNDLQDCVCVERERR